MRMWQYSGMTHVRLIRNLVRVFGDILARGLPTLNLEITKFNKAYAQFESKVLNPFMALIDPTAMEIFNSRDFPELLKLGKLYAVTFDKTFENYAPNLGKSVYHDHFLAILDVLKERCSEGRTNQGRRC